MRAPASYRRVERRCQRGPIEAKGASIDDNLCRKRGADRLESIGPACYVDRYAPGRGCRAAVLSARIGGARPRKP